MKIIRKKPGDLVAGDIITHDVGALPGFTVVDVSRLICDHEWYDSVEWFISVEQSGYPYTLFYTDDDDVPVLVAGE